MAAIKHGKKYELLVEYKCLKEPGACPDGIYVMPHEDNIHFWHGVMFIQTGFYRSAVYRFQLLIPEEYPEERPSLRFQSDVFHPLVNASGQFSLQQGFAEWVPHRDHILHILHYLKSAFTEDQISKLDSELCPNKESLNMFHKEREVFLKMVKNSVDISRTESNIFETPSAIMFSPVSDRKYSEFIARIRDGNIKALVAKVSATSDLFQDVKSSIYAGLKYIVS